VVPIVHGIFDRAGFRERGFVTYVGNIRFNRVGDAPIIGKLIEVYWKKSKIGDREEEAETMRAALRRKLGGEAEAPAEEELIIEPPLELETTQPTEKNFFQWLFQDFYASMSKMNMSSLIVSTGSCFCACHSYR